MYALDFEYDGRTLSQYGFMICDFNGSSDVNVADTGFNITFAKVRRNNGKRYGVASSGYEDCMECTFQICRDQCDCDDMEIDSDQYLDLVRWLNRREFLKLRFINDDEYDRPYCYYNASFNIKKITIGGKLYGLELTAQTDSPFGHGLTFDREWQIDNVSQKAEFLDMSSDIGVICPDVTITCRRAGNITITNTMMNSAMTIKNCANNEVITIHGDTQIITSSVQSHKLYDDFNYEFLKIGNTFESRKNTITVSMPCKIRITYDPIVKDIP